MNCDNRGNRSVDPTCLSNFKMPWLLNRELNVNKSTTIMVNAFKLASASAFFWNRLRDVGRYGALCIDCEDPDGLELALRFAHEGQVSISIENVVDLMQVARRYEMPRLLRDCESFVLSSITPKNCLSLKRVMSASDLASNELLTQVDDYIFAHFMRFAAVSDDFLQLSLEQLLEYLRTDRLNAPDELRLFKLVCCKWVAHDLHHRLPFMPLLIKNLRLGVIRQEQALAQIERHPFVQHNFGKCRAIFSQARRLLLRQQRGLRPPINCDVIGTPRLAYGCLLVFGGGMFCSPFRRLKVYDNHRDHWRMLDRRVSAPVGRMFFASCVLNQQLYMIGGLSERFLANATAYRFCLRKHQWFPSQPLLEARFFMSVVVLQDTIYIIGGLGEEWITTRTVESFRGEEDSVWTYVAPMHVPRNRAACASIRNRLFVCGGVSADLHQTLDAWNRSCECYDPDTDQWTFIAALPEEVWGCYELVAHAQRLYLIQSLQIHSYNHEDGTWHLEKLTGMRAHLSFTVAVLDDEIYRLCDWVVEKWSPGQTEWTHVAVPSWPFGWGHQCLVISGADIVAPLLGDAK